MKEKEYHKARRMFFLIERKLVIPPEGVEKSHFEWLKEIGWPDNKIKEFINNELRGVLNPDGNIRFYVGEDFEINEEIERKFFEILPELVKLLSINPEAEIGGGAIKQNNGTFWPAKKNYGKVKNYLNK